MRCPVCRATVEQGPQCRRCRVDLGLLFAVEEQAHAARATVARLASQGRLDEALYFAEGALALRRDAPTQRLMAVLHLLRRDFARAWQAYQAVREASAGP